MAGLVTVSWLKALSLLLALNETIVIMTRRTSRGWNVAELQGAKVLGLIPNPTIKEVKFLK